MARAIADSVGNDDLYELRLRLGRAVVAMTSSLTDPRRIVKFAGKPYLLARDELDGIVARATDMSPYAVSDELLKGYIPFKGLRIGVGGEGVSDGGKLIGVKNISYLVIRVPKQIKSAADGVFDLIATGEGKDKRIANTLIISPPRGGKTTMLREVARKASAFKNVVIIDEREEIAGVAAMSFDIGDAEVISGVPKAVACENCVRAMSPEVIVTDEIFGDEETQAVCDATRAGVSVVASLHGEDVGSVAKSRIFAPLFERFELAVSLSLNPVGSVKRAVKIG